MARGGKSPELEVHAITVLFYDGVCGLCNRLIQFLLRRDRDGRIAYATLQGTIARNVLAKHGADPTDLDTVYVVADWRTPAERALSQSAAILHALRQLGGGWGVLARLGRLVPSPVADSLYRVVARNRYRVFGKYESCPLPSPEWRRRFLD